ncbi:MAG TPA: DUF4142 domain-containing protein [Chryseosolibacter sp.]
MRNIFKKTMNALGVVVIAGMVAACSSSLTYNEAVQKNARKITDPEKLDDARFLVDAASYNILATKLSEAAINSGYSASVVRLAKENKEEQAEMGKELKKLARQEHVALPAEMNEDHQKLLAQLTASDRREFDRNYIRILREASEDGSHRFEQMATEGESDDVRAFAARELHLFESSKSGLETVDAELLKTY